MIQFKHYTLARTVDAYSKFLREKKAGRAEALGLVDNPGEARKGRLKKYPEAAVADLIRRVNEKAARCEADDTTFGERLELARDYLGYSDGDIGKLMGGLSREIIRRWRENIPGRPPEARIDALAEVLQVPRAWLSDGGEANLPANSHLGLRVGPDEKLWKETLYSLETDVVAELPDDADVVFSQAYIEQAILTRPELAQAARRAGGRWQIVGGAMLFAPWSPIEEHGLSRRYWSDEVEAIIEEELATRPSVYGAWHALKRRCDALGLTPDEYPRLISLHKRIDKERLRAEEYGVDLNEAIAQAVAQHPQLH